jgi:hypothetical protein
MKYNPRYNNVLNRKSYLKKGVPSNSEGRNGDSLLCLLNKGIVLCYKINNRWEEIGVFKKLDKKFNNSSLNKLTVDTITSDSDLLITNNNVGSTSTRLNDINLEPKGMVFINKDYDTTRPGINQAINIDFDRTGAVSSGVDTNLGLVLNVNATGATGGTINNTGANITVGGDTGGSSVNTALSIRAHGADTNNGIYINVDNGLGHDFKNISSADSDDFFAISTKASGETTILTVDDGGAQAHMKFEPDGSFLIKETASAGASVAAYGQLWVKSDTPNELYFTTDAGDDIQLTDGTSAAGGGGSSGLNSIVAAMVFG